MVANENIINLYGKTYKEITYDNGESILQRYSDKYQIWITLQFSDEEYLNQIKKVTSSCLLNKNLSL